ncbi:MAG: terminase family protein [Aquificaceae bacterium]
MKAESILLPYQRIALQGIETKRFSVLMWARQTGKSFLVSYYAIKRAVEFVNHRVVVISPSERQSKELLDKVKMHVQALKLAKVDFFEDTQTFQLEARFPNGSKVIALPSKPETVRGFTGDVIMDETAFFEKGFEVYQAVFPTITRNQRYKLIAISTPRTKKDLFYHLWQTAQEDPAWFSYRLTIYDAVQNGLAIDPEELRRGIKNELAWKSEYLCEFIDDEDVLLPYEVIQSCEEENIEVDDLRLLRGDVFVGVDIGRRRDLTVISILEKLGSVFYLRRLEILRNVSFSEQFKVIDHIASFARRLAIDETGIGMQLAEELARRWGEAKVQRVYFTARVKEELAEKLRHAFIDKIIRIPPDNDLREDLHSVKRLVSDSGNIRYEGNTEDGHADRFWALALALHAGKEETKEISPLVFYSPEKTVKRWWHVERVI